MKFKKICFFITMILLLSSCGASKSIGRKTNEVNEKATNVYVYIKTFSDSTSKRIKGIVEEVLNEKGLKNKVYIKSFLDLKTNDEINKDVVDFGANRILTIQLKYSEFEERQYSRSSTVVYDVNLYDLSTENTVWEGEITLYSKGFKAFKARLEDVVSQMKNENLLN